jgi:hypothetical protein
VCVCVMTVVEVLVILQSTASKGCVFDGSV